MAKAIVTKATIKGLPRVLIIIAALLIWTAMLTPSSAQETPAANESTDTPVFGTRPVDGTDLQPIRLELTAGSTAQSGIYVSNHGEAPIDLFLYTSNAGSAINGGLRLGPQAETLQAPANWLQFSTEAFSLDPGEERLFEITISVPDDAIAGEYVGAIAAETVNAFAVSEGSMFRQKARKVIGVSITVPGSTTTSFELGSPTINLSTTYTLITVPIENTGSTRVVLTGDATLADGDGESLATIPVSLGPIFAWTSTSIQFVIPVPLPEQEYVLTLVLSDSATGTSSEILDARIQATILDHSPDVTDVAVSFTDVTITPVGNPVQFASIEVTLENVGPEIPAIILSISSYLNGELVEEFELAKNVRLFTGVAAFNERYIPIIGWKPGEWTFSLNVVAVDPRTGIEAPLVTGTPPDIIVIS